MNRDVFSAETIGKIGVSFNAIRFMYTETVELYALQKTSRHRLDFDNTT